MILILSENKDLKLLLTYFKYFLYGLIQGITEFLPISSSAHLKVISILLGVEDPGSSISAIVQLGSVIAILFYFRNDIHEFLKKKDNKNFSLFNSKIIKSIFIGTFSILFLGSLIKYSIPNFTYSFLRSNFLIGLISIFTGFLMYLADHKKNNKITLKNHSYLNSFLIGVGQSFAIIPGVSRSGITISIALLLGWKRVDSARYSFLLGIPSISIAAFVEIIDSLSNHLFFNLGPLLIGLFTAFITSFLSIRFFIKYISFKGLKIFVIYKFAFGILLLLSDGWFN